MLIAIFTFLGSVDIPGLLIVIMIFSVPTFFLVKRVYRRKFGHDKEKVVIWSIVTSVILSTVFVVALIVGLVIWSINTEG